MERFWNEFHFLPSLPLPEPKFARHWGLDDWCPDALCAAVAELHARKHYDAVLVNYVWMSKVLVGLDNTLKIIDTHDLFGDRHKIAIREGMEPRWYFTSLSEEDRGFNRADLLLGIQDRETAEIASRVDVPAMVIGHLMPPRFLMEPSHKPPRFTFGYLGSGNPWNIRSIQALDDALASGPAMDWMLAGSILKQPLTLKTSPYRFGFVKELKDFYNDVQCVINPMLGGTGLKIKTVEALSYGRPVIGTVDAFIGLPVQHEAHKLQSVEACAEMMCEYTKNSSLQEEIELASRALYFSYALNISRGIDLLGQAIERGVALQPSLDTAKA
ncbi:glycosyltransferase [Teichococcus aestuarii]